MAIQFPMKHALSALVLATLGMTAGSAFAQSTEYRRGYDQGYRDGVEATNAQAQPARNRLQTPVLAPPLARAMGTLVLRTAECQPH